MLPLSRLSFYLLESSEIRESEMALSRAAGELTGRLPATTRAALATCFEGINSYYSNLIEGQGTKPVEAEKALKAALLAPPTPVAAEKARLAVAHIQTERWMREQLAKGPGHGVISPDFIRQLHGRFVSQLPESMREVRGDDGSAAVNVPGEFRQRDIKVGRHRAPPHAEVPGLAVALAETWAQLPKTPAHALLAHHRLAWIHPFLDGNGRIARLVTDGMLAVLDLDAGGVWSLSRGLARNRERYYELLDRADQPRAGDYDGRGELSQKAANDFALFMLDTALDQVKFMTGRLHIEQVKDRVARFCAERSTILGRDEREAALLVEAMFMGKIDRSETPRLLGLGERAARKIVAACVEDGLLVSESSRAPLHPAYPVYSAAYLFPQLFEISDPRAAMLETLNLDSYYM